MNSLLVTTTEVILVKNQCVYVVVLSGWNKTSTRADPLLSHTDKQQPVTVLETGFRSSAWSHSQKMRRN